MSRRFESLIARHYYSNGELRTLFFPRRLRLWAVLMAILGRTL